MQFLNLTLLSELSSKASLIALLFLSIGCARLPKGYEPKNGDLVFQSLPLNPLRGKRAIP
jgi:hypothetical protein